MTARLAACCLIAAALVGAGCSRQESAWRHSAAQDSVAAYEAYLRDYPAGPHVGEAQARLSALREQQEWDRALRFNTPEAFQRYLSGYPAGRYAAAAREKLSDFLLARAPGGAEPLAPAAERRPTGTLAAAAGAGDGRIQLGAFGGGEGAARRAWADLSNRHGDLLAGLTPRVDVVERDGKSLWRLQAGPLSESRAQEACAALKARGAACIVVRD